jgi:hypothetical protein
MAIVGAVSVLRTLDCVGKPLSCFFVDLRLVRPLLGTVEDILHLSFIPISLASSCLRLRSLSAAMAKALKQLLDLPDEILNCVAEAVDDVTSLRALARTCRRLQDQAERFIYCALIIEHGAQARGLYKAISRRLDEQRCRRSSSSFLLRLPLEALNLSPGCWRR